MKLTLTKTTDLKIKNSLKRWRELATDYDVINGTIWYSDAQAYALELSDKYNIEPYIVASVISALSPNNKWERNKTDAESVINAFINGESPNTIKVCTYNANKYKAFKILSGDVQINELSPKTHAFSMNIGLLSESHVTIDKWHIRACLAHPNNGIVNVQDSITNKQYQRIEAITAQLAYENGLPAYTYQAVIWLVIKRVWDRQ